MSKHTPGPWKVTLNHEHEATTGLESLVVAEVPGDVTAYIITDKAAKEDEASVINDARLIAAAPELLEALEEWGEELVEFGACGCDTASCRGTCTPAKTRAAIAKARGEV